MAFGKAVDWEFGEFVDAIRSQEAAMILYHNHKLSLSRQHVSLVCLVYALGLLLSGCGPTVEGPYTLEHAIELEKSPKHDEMDRTKKLDEAAQIYQYVFKENQHSHPDVAGKALYEGGLFLKDPNRYGITEERRNNGVNQAEKMWRQLKDEMPDQARKLLNYGMADDKYLALVRQVDERNRTDFKYKILDTLVNMTGKQPMFSYAFALILLAFVVKLLTFPLVKRQYASQREMQKVQPLIKELQGKFKGAELSEKTWAIYKEHKVNPFAGCWPSLIQLPFLLFIFYSIQKYEHAFVAGKFLWIGSPLSVGSTVFGANLASADIPLTAMYALTNYITMRMNPAPDPAQQQQQTMMAAMMSIMFFWMFLTYKWSSAFVLYWLILNLISIFQQYHFIYQPNKLKVATAGGDPPLPSTKGPKTVPVPAITEATPQRVRPRKKK